jgi:hypothetical protein
MSDKATGIAFYFSGIRMLVTVPILLLSSINIIYHVGMLFLIELDLFLGNFIAWLLFGNLIALFGAGIAVTISFLPVIILPLLWYKPGIWGVAKIGLFAAALLLTTVAANLMSILNLAVLDWVAELRTTIWWGELWGVIS